MNDASSSPRTAAPEREWSPALKQAASSWKARIDAGLGPDEETALQVWLDTSPDHGAALARIDAVWAKFDRPIHAGMAEDLLQALAHRASQRRRRRTISAAAGVMLLLTVAVAWRFGGGAEGRLPEPALAGQPPVAPNAVVRFTTRQVLPDGTIAELKNGAEITVAFSDDVRRVELRHGVAHFQVTKNPARPFIVVAGGIEARAVGTAFSVELRQDAVEVLVTEGRVAVNPSAPTSPTAGPLRDGPSPQPLAVVDVGNGVVVSRATGASPPPRVDELPPAEMDERLAWRAPRVEFSHATLAEAIALLNEHAALRASPDSPAPRFAIDDPAVAAIRISGLFRVDRSDAFIGLLKKGFGVEADRRADGSIVLRKAR